MELRTSDVVSAIVMGRAPGALWTRLFTRGEGVAGFSTPCITSMTLAPQVGHQNPGVMAKVSRLSVSASPGQSSALHSLLSNQSHNATFFLWRICGPVYCPLWWFQWILSTYLILSTLYGALRRESFLKWGQACTLYGASSDPVGWLNLLRDSEGIFLIVQSLVLFSASAK